MKYLLQFASVILVGLLAFPAVLAQGLCVMSEAQSAGMECCSVDHAGVLRAAAPVVLDCNGTCCSVAPQNSVPSYVSNKFIVDSTGPAASDGTAILVPVTPREIDSLLIAATGRVQDLPVLLSTFRI
jgi:hypothetical protein